MRKLEKNKFYWKIVCIIIGVFCFSQVYAKKCKNISIDVYRSSQITADQIKKEYSKQLCKVIHLYSTPESLSSIENTKKMQKFLEPVLEGISKKGDFALLNFSAVIYPGETYPKFSFDIVDKKDKKRLSYFIKAPAKKDIPDPDSLIATWKEYEATGFKIGYIEKKHSEVKNCPAYHCVFGFEHPLLKKYEKIFTAGVPKNKLKIIEILKEDKDVSKRQAAAFLLGHLKNGEEIIKILSPYMRDADPGVRNNAMRVIAETLTKLKNPSFPIQDAVIALDFPYNTDRNKALYVLSSLVTQPRYAKYIINHAGSQLMDELKLSQDNVHDTSYMVLQEISGKHFGARDYSSWEKWLKENKKSV